MKSFLSCLLLISYNLAAMEHEASTNTPADAYGMHICAFHIARDDPKVVIETQHYCMGLREDLFQCLLFETTAPDVKPKLLGVEYVISNDLYQKLPEEEKKLWHPHDFEVRKGLLALIGASREEDEKVMKLLVTTWGKTWHTWPDPKTDLPLGAPRLMWSAEKEGQVPAEMVKARDVRWNIDTTQLMKNRESYLPEHQRKGLHSDSRIEG